MRNRSRQNGITRSYWRHKRKGIYHSRQPKKRFANYSIHYSRQQPAKRLRKHISISVSSSDPLSQQNKKKSIKK